MTASADELADLERLLELCEVQSVRSGVPLPLGAHRRGTGVNFALLSRHATGVRLDLFARAGDAVPSRTIILDLARNKTGDIWHVWLDGIEPDQLYGYRVAGAFAPHAGHRFNPSKLLVDPYATAIVLVGPLGETLGYDPRSPLRDLARDDRDDAAAAPKSIVTHDDFDWRGDQPLRRPWSDTVLYELHVRGFTQRATVDHPGTYRGLVEKLPYLVDLGITAVELMRILEFDHRNGNYWGYDPIGFFAAKASYASVPGAALLELKEMVRACHAHGIEVILDLVVNHTVEGDQLGPTVGLRGVDNALYYWLADDPRYYRDFTGTGHTIRASHPVVRDMILDVLRYWVIEAHVDGFRFDLASVLGRDGNGRVVADAPLLERIAEDPILRDTKLIAEAWDVAGAYQVGSFSERRWAEWNGIFRDDVRRFWRGDAGMLGAFASRLAGSADVYQHTGKSPECSINFVTCHDGFTLADLVSYAHKHNEANGEGNRDGIDENHSANHGVEGPTTDPDIDALRLRQIKNFLVTLAVARGVPMLLAGDELRRTQHGNNNAYCQDNATSWLDWSLYERDAELHAFVRALLALRRAHPVLRREAFYTAAEVDWLAPDLGPVRWHDPAARQLAWLVREPAGALCMLFNAAGAPCTFALPAGWRWRVAIDTARARPAAIAERVVALAHSAIILIA